MSNRILQINELIQKELGQIILREVEFPKNTLVTITRVETSPDLSQAKVYVSCLPDNQGDRMIHVLKRQGYHIQHKLNKRLETRIIPRIRFVKELKTMQAGRIEQILDKIKKKG
jgi:ribosome-binding factor A